MIERELDVTTPEGQMKTFIYHPEHQGPHPVVLYLMDAPSIRPALLPCLLINRGHSIRPV